jgi:hypothetical protein
MEKINKVFTGKVDMAYGKQEISPNVGALRMPPSQKKGGASGKHTQSGKDFHLVFTMFVPHLGNGFPKLKPSRRKQNGS